MKHSPTRRRPASLVAVIITVLLGLLFIASGVAFAAQSGGTVPKRKVDVCKYVGTPGTNERLQTGQNPIEVSVNSIKNAPHNPPQVGDYFADAQGRSLVVAVAGDPQASITDCPGYVVPTPSETVSTPTTIPSMPSTVPSMPSSDPATTETSSEPPTSEAPSSETPTPSTTTTAPSTTPTVPSTPTTPSTPPSTTQAPSMPVSTAITTKPPTMTSSTVIKKTQPPRRSHAPPSTRLSNTGVSAGTQTLLGLALLLVGVILAFGPGVQRRFARNQRH